MARPINWLFSPLALLKISQMACLLLVIVFFIDGRTQWSVYSVIYVVSYIIIFGVLLSILIHFFQVTKAIPSLPWYKLELIWNTVCALFCLATFLILAWDWWQMYHGSYRHHNTTAPRNIGIDGWRRRVIIVGVSTLLASGLFIFTLLRVKKSGIN